MSLMPRGVLIIAVGFALTLQTSWMSTPSLAAQTATQSLVVSLNELEHGIEDRLKRVDEFKFIEKEASKLGVRAWLFGGTAAGYGHYVKWDLQREKGDLRFQPDRFDYDYTNIYRSTQDLDIVIDGNTEQAKALQQLLSEKYPHLQGSKTAWEVRLLTHDMGDKQAILNNPDFMNQHTDSNSTGLIEITKPKNREPVVRDVRDWSAHQPHFLKDVHDGALHYYFSPLHETTRFAREGRNPPILSVVRYLTKAFQYELTLRPEDLLRIKKVIDELNPKELTRNAYVAHWIEKNGKKLIQNAVNIEYAWDTLENLGLRRKLIAIKDDPTVEKSLAWWMDKEPLRTRPVGQGIGKTAKELEIDVVAHETNNFLAYESITRAHTGDPNVLISRQNVVGEMAAYGNGFYTAMGRTGAAGTGLTIRFHINPNAREGSDFAKSSDYIIVRNKAALRVIPETLNIGPLEYLRILEQEKNFDKNDLGIVEKLKRRIGNKLEALSEAQENEIVAFMKQAFERPGDVSPSLIDGWLSFPISRKHPDLINILLDKAITNKELALHILPKQELRNHTEWVDKMLNQSWVDREVVTELSFRDPRLPDHPEWIDALLTHEALDEDTVTYAFKKVPWWEHPEWIKKLLERGHADKEIAEHVLPNIKAKEHPEWVKALIDKGTVDKDIASYVLHRPHWAEHPEFMKALIQNGNADYEIISLDFNHAIWQGHPEFVETLLKKENLHEGIAFSVLSEPHWQGHPEWVETIVRAATADENMIKYVLNREHWKNHSELRRLAGGMDPTVENLRAAFQRGESVRVQRSAAAQCILQNLSEL